MKLFELAQGLKLDGVSKQWSLKEILQVQLFDGDDSWLSIPKFWSSLKRNIIGFNH